MYRSAPDFHTDVNSWIGCSSDKLYFFPLGKGEDSITVINPDTLEEEGKLELEGAWSLAVGRLWFHLSPSLVADCLGPMCLYASGEGLGQILAKKEV